MSKLFKLIIDFLKAIFRGKEVKPEVIEIENNSGETITVNEPIETGAENNTDEIEDAQPDGIILSGKIRNMKILIDNGHGTNTPGKRSPYAVCGVEPAIEFYEYKWNREIAKEIVNRLVAKGYSAALLVNEDTDVSLTERANRVNAICNMYGTSNVILLSIHANAAGNGTKWMNAKGWSAFTTKGTTKSDTIAEYLYDEAEKNFKGRQIRKDMSDGDRDWESNFTVIYKSKCPAVLTENFFYDNVDDVTYILSDEGREAVIRTHVDAIINYLNSL